MLEPITTQPDSIRVLVDSVGFVIYQHAADTVVVSLKSNLIDSVLVALNHKLNDASISSKDWLIAITSIVAGITSGLIVVIIGSKYQRRIAEEQNRIARDQLVNQNQNFRDQLTTTIDLATKQLTANLVSTARQKRIEELRTLLSDLYATLRMIAAIHSTRTKPYPVKDPDGLDFRLSQECEKVLKLSASICFYLDIENKQDEDLFDKLSAIQSVLKKKDYEGIKKFTDELLIAGAILFKLEFEKVARFE